MLHNIEKDSLAFTKKFQQLIENMAKFDFDPCSVYDFTMLNMIQDWCETARELLKLLKIE